MTTRRVLGEKGRAIRGRLGLSSFDAGKLAGADGLGDEVVFGRVWARPGLGLEDRMLATLCALSTKQYLPQLKSYAGSALHIGLAPEAIQEVTLHCAMYVGLPSMENSLRVMNEVFAERGLQVDRELPEPLELDALMERGLETMTALHAERAQGGYAAPDAAASALYNTAIDYLYGEIWNRPGLTRRQRMICSVAAFTANQMESQQRKFFRSALNVGLTREEVIEIIVQTGPYSGFPPALNALSVVQEVLG
jgi:4-carboxymuconolactone decarboxylase